MDVRQRILLAAVLAFGLAANAGFAQEYTSGVVIEKVASNSEAEKAGIREGDILLAWVRGGTKGEIASPFDLFTIETEQAPRGNVILEGLRGKQKQSWNLGPSGWGATARPNLPETLLASYMKCQQLADAGKLAEAAEQWRQLAQQINGSQSKWLHAWLLAHAAKLLAAAKEWQTADDAYQGAIQDAGKTRPAVTSELLRDWADAYQQRNDLKNAEKYYEQSLIKAQTNETENLTIAKVLSDLGTVSWEQGDVEKAERYHQRALSIRKKLAPESLDVVQSLQDLAMMVAYERTDLTSAEDLNRQALAIAEKIAPDGLDAAESLKNLGRLSWERSDFTKAYDYLFKALAIQQRLAPGSLYVADTFGVLGLVAYHSGDLDESEEYQTKALQIRQEKVPGSFLVARAFNNLGNIASERGDLAKAEQYHRKALAIREKLAPVSSDTASSLCNLCIVATWRGDPVSADRYCRRSLAIREKLNPESLDVALSLEATADVALDRDDLKEAEDNFQRALKISQRLAPGSFYELDMLRDLGRIYARKGDLVEAERYLDRAVAMLKQLAPHSPYLATWLNDAGNVSRKRGNLAAAEKYYREALAIEDNFDVGTFFRADTLVALAEIADQKGELETAAQLFNKGLDALEHQTAHLGGTESGRSVFRAKYADYYNGYIDLLLRQKKTELAFQVLERSRAQTLLETLAAAHVGIRRGVDPGLLQRERSLHQSFASHSNRRAQLLGQKHTDEQLAALDQEGKDMLAQYEDVEEHIRVSSPGYAALTQPHSLSAREVQQHLLDGNSLLLEYWLGEERSYVFVVTPDSVSAYELPKQAEIETAARRIYDILVARSHALKGESWEQRMLRADKLEAQYPEAAAALSQMVLGRVAPLLQDKRLLIVSDGILQYIPFTALPSPEMKPGFEPLIAEHEIVNLPSASVMELLQRESAERSRPAKAVAVLADPVFSLHDERVSAGDFKRIQLHDQDSRGAAETDDTLPQALLLRSATDLGMAGNFPRLLFSREEADSILKEAPIDQSMKAVDFQASLATATNPDLGQYRIVHIATHGLLDSEHPELSGLVLSLVDRHGKQQNGFLQLTDIYNLNLPVDMVVLSACETGLGKQVKAEGLVGITRGFMYAGASRVVASLWKVDDAATAELMGKFYRGIFKDDLSPAAALQRAQTEMWKQKRWHSPYYWAGFVLQGEP